MLTDEQKVAILNDWFAWCGGDLPISEGQIMEYLESSYPFDYSEDEAMAYLRSEIVRPL